MKEGSRAQCARVAVLAAALAVGAIRLEESQLRHCAISPIPTRSATKMCTIPIQLPAPWLWNGEFRLTGPGHSGKRVQ